MDRSLGEGHHVSDAGRELGLLNRIDSGQIATKSSATQILYRTLLTLQDAPPVFVHETLRAYIMDIVNDAVPVPSPLPGWNKHVRVGASRVAALRSCRSPRQSPHVRRNHDARRH